jgi:hypothetical protein
MKRIIAFATRFIPRHHLQRVAHLLLRMLSVFYRGNRFEDPITGITYRKLLPYGRITPRQNALAPDSLSLERHRLIWLYLRQETNFFTDQLRFLHLAPEYCFLKRFRSLPNIDYVTGDLVSPWADLHFDAHEMPFDDASFDVVMANHLLEHVDNDHKVMSECYRILRTGGWGIFQVPIDYNNAATLEDKSTTDPAERERLYWQRDHVRLYGRDYPERLRQAGFTVTEDDFQSRLGEDLARRYAFMPGERVYFCRKQ